MAVPDRIANDDPPPSLVERIVAAARPAPRRPREPGQPEVTAPDEPVRDTVPLNWRVAAGLAAAIALAPVLTIVGAHVLTAAVERESVALAPRAAPLLADAADTATRRAALAGLLARPAIGGTVEAVASALPQDASLTMLAVDGDGAVRVEAAGPDPDVLRQALRRAAPLAGAQVTGQVRGDGAIRIALRAAAE